LQLIGVVPSYAATGGLPQIQNFNLVFGGLRYAENGYAPERYDDDIDTGKVRLSWPLNNMTPLDKMRLTWNSEHETAGIVMSELMIRKTNFGYYVVDFNLFKNDNGKLKRFADSDGGEAYNETLYHNETQYTIVNRQNETLGIADFLSQNHFDEETIDERVNNIPPLPSSPDNYLYDLDPNKSYLFDFDNGIPGAVTDSLSVNPSFNVGNGKGFLFEYYNYSIGILLEENNLFHVSVEDLEKGYIYDFELEHKFLTTDGNKYAPSVESVFTGLDYNNFSAIPLVREEVDKKVRAVWNDELESESDFFIDSAVPQEPLTANEYKTNVEDMSVNKDFQPGKDLPGLTVRFDLPKKFSKGKNKFIPIGPSNPVGGSLDVRLSFDGKIIDVKDIGSAVPYFDETTTNAEIIEKEVKLVNALNKGVITATSAGLTEEEIENGRIAVDFFGLNASSILETRVSISANNYRNILIPTSTDSSNPTLNGYRQVFTLPEMRVEALGGRYYLIVKKFTNVNMTHLLYRLMANGHLNREYYHADDLNEFIIMPIDLEGVSGAADEVMFPLEIPVENPLGYGNIYQVQATTGSSFPDMPYTGSSQLLYSQVIQFHPTDPIITYVSPGDVKVVNSKDAEYRNLQGIREPKDRSTVMYLPEDDPTGDSANLEFWMQWDVIDETALESMLNAAAAEITTGAGITAVPQVEIVYEIKKGEVPSNDATSPLTAVKLTIRRAENIDPANPESPASGYEVTYTEGQIDSDGNFIAKPENEYIQNKGPSWFLNRGTIHIADIHFKFTNKDVKRISRADPAPLFQFPDIYFLNVRPRGLTYGSKGDDRAAGLWSRYASLTLNDFTKLQPPPPQNLTATAVLRADEGDEVPDPEDYKDVRVSYALPFDGIKRFIDTWKSQKGYKDVSVNLYVGTNEDAIKNNFYDKLELTYEQRNDIFNSSGSSFDYNALKTINPYGIDLSNALLLLQRPTNSAGLIQIKNIPVFTNGQPLENFPQDQITVDGLIDAENGMPGPANTTTLLLTNLDPNQRYFLLADLVVTLYADEAHTPDNVLEAGVVRFQEASLLTGIQDVTISGEVEPPDESDRDPSAPYVVVVEETSLTATIGWNRITAEADADGVTSKIEYEVLRLQNIALPDDATGFLSKESVDTLKSRFSTSLPKSWRLGDTPVHNSEIDYEPDMQAVDPENTGPPIQLTDKTLLPNSVYYYYVRTYKTVTVNGNVVNLVSTWSRVSVTTLPVDRPFNLRVEAGPEYVYDRKTEVVISWDARMENIDLLRQGVLYFRYQLREEGGDWGEFVTIPFSSLVTSQLPEQVTHFVYSKITGLEPMQTYQIRLQLYDTKTQDGSAFSDILTFITAFDQDKYDEEKEIETWLDYYKELLEALLTNPYWVTRSNAAELTVIVRPGDMFNGPLYSTADSAVNLYNAGQDRATYYIPASVINTANANEKGFRIPYADMDILTSPGMLNEAYNDVLNDMLEAKHEREVSDYFVRVNISRGVINEQIENMPVLSKQTAVSMEAVGTVTTYRDTTNTEVNFRDISAWDERVYEQAAEFIAAKLTDQTIRDRIKQEVEQDRLTEDTMLFIESLVNETRSEVLNLVSRQLEPGGILDSSYTLPINNLDKPMFIVNKPLPEGTYVDGYKLESGMWQPQPVTENYNGHAITAASTGTYVFAGRTADIPGIEDVPRGRQISAFTAKYGLEDYLGYDGVDLTQNATRLMVAGSVARIAGAPKTADPINWISSNLNISPAARNANGLVQNQEAVAMLMALYEYKTNTQIKNLTIRNYQTTAGMTGLDDRYTQAVRAAYELGVLTDTGLRPANPVTIGDLLDMLGMLNAKVKL
jgi:hypothetical protein